MTIFNSYVKLPEGINIDVWCPKIGNSIARLNYPSLVKLLPARRSLTCYTVPLHVILHTYVGLTWVYHGVSLYSPPAR